MSYVFNKYNCGLGKLKQGDPGHEELKIKNDLSIW